ncbi:MAG: fibronectin type III domain-containing protein [Bacillota bacterium]|nr:fibronectin type III domain-containing protein [Bacillota bacterium]
MKNTVKSRLLKCVCRKTVRGILSFTMALIMIFSYGFNVFADATWPGNFLVTEASFNGGNAITANSSGQFESSSITSVYESVPVDSTFTIKFGVTKVFLFRGSWDPITGGFSTVLNRDLVQIQDSNGNAVTGVTVSNANDPGNTSGTDSTVKVHPNSPLNYDTNYKLVVKKYFSQSNRANPPAIRGAVPDDVVIPFKTEALQKPTVTKAELRGNTLTLSGLPKDKNLEYNLVVDGNFQDSNWKVFTYTDDTANIEVSNVNLTANSKIEVGYAKDDNSVPTDVSDPITVFYASTSGPSFTGAVLSGNTLILNGFPKNAANLEYRVAADGTNYTEWKDLSISGTSGTVSAEGVKLIEGQSIIQVRYKACAPWSASDISQNSFIYALGTTAPLEQGKDTVIDAGIKINSVNLNTPGDGEANTVTVRNAKGEKLPAPAGMTSMGFDGGEDDYDCGGTYGFTLKGSGDGNNNHVKITIPYQLPTVRPKDLPDDAVIDDSKVSIYMLVPFHLGDSNLIWQVWKYMPATVDSFNHTATVDISDFDVNGKDIILSPRFDSKPPSNMGIYPYSRTATSLSFELATPDYSGIKSLVLTRVNRADPSDVKKVTLYAKDYPSLADPGKYSNTIYTDTDPKPGVNYDYTLSDEIDMLGNKSTDKGTISATVDSMDTLVKEAEQSIYKSVRDDNISDDPNNPTKIRFAVGDSQNSVTQKIVIPSVGNLNYGSSSITWTSDRPDIISTGPDKNDIELHPPVDANGNPVKDGVVVTLTGTIKYTSPIDHFTRQSETAAGTVAIPLTVKWNIANGEVTLNNEFLHDPNMGGDYRLNTDPTKDINTAVKFDGSIANTIVFNHSIVLKDKTVYEGSAQTYDSQNYVIDAQGKTLKANFDGALFNELQMPGGSFTLKNAVIDMNHKAGPVLSAEFFGAKVIFDNVKIINAENCQYGVILQEQNSGSFSANNCQFSSFKVSAIAALTPAYSHTSPVDASGMTYTSNYSHIPVQINNCTFDGDGKPGYGVLDTYGDVSIKDSTFKNYKGSVNTGWNSSNDSYDFQFLGGHTLDADGNSYYQYKGIPDNSPSAGILVKELGLANISGNTITNSDNSILAWIGEKNFSFLWSKPASGFAAYPTINGIIVDSSKTEQAVNNILAGNTIFEAKDGTNKIVIQDASDRYNRTTILSKANEPDITAPSWNKTSKAVASKISDNSITLSWNAANDNVGVTSYKIYENGKLIGTVNGDTTTFDVKNLTSDTEYTFKIEAGDSSENWSTTGPTVVVNTAYIPNAVSVNIASMHNSIEIGSNPIEESVTGEVYDQHGNKITSQKINWSLVGIPIGININNEGVLTVQPFATIGSVTVKGTVDGTNISNTKQFTIKAAVAQNTITHDDTSKAITDAANLGEVKLPASTSAVIAIDGTSLSDVNASNKVMNLTNEDNVVFKLKPSDLNLGEVTTLNDVQQLQVSSEKVDTKITPQLSTDGSINNLPEGTYSSVGTPFKLSAVAVLNNNDQQQVTGFNSPINISIPVPTDLKIGANQELRVCRFNTNTGKWEDKGEATLNNGTITFNTVGFSYWTVMVKTIDSSNNTGTNSSTNTGGSTGTSTTSSTNTSGTTVGTVALNSTTGTVTSSTTSATTSNAVASSVSTAAKSEAVASTTGENTSTNTDLGSTNQSNNNSNIDSSSKSNKESVSEVKVKENLASENNLGVWPILAIAIFIIACAGVVVLKKKAVKNS